MKFLLSILLVALSLFAAAYEQGEPLQIGKYTNNQSATIELETHFGRPFILDKSVLNKLSGETIFHVDLVYTQYHESMDFDQEKLNEQRIVELKKAIPQLSKDQPQWTIYEQTGAVRRAEAKAYFHGFVIHYGHSIDYKNQSAFFSDLEKPFAEVELVNELGGKVEYYSGSSIEMPAFSVTHQNGEQAKGKYTLYYREFRNESEMALSGIPMQYREFNDDEVFNSAGMYELRAKKDGEELILVKPATVNFKIVELVPDCDFFAMNDDGDWTKEDRPLSDYFGMSASSSIKFYLGGFDPFGREIKVMKYRPVREIDQMGYQGYTRIKQQQILDKNQLYMGLSTSAWRKFNLLYDSVDSIQAIVQDIDKKGHGMLVYQKNATGFIEAVMGQKLEDLKLVKSKNETLYTLGGTGDATRRLNVLGDEPIPSSPGLIKGLQSPNFGVYNCDQTMRIEDPVALKPTYYDAVTGEKLQNLYVACVIDLSINASLSYHPNHLVCNGAGNTKVVLFTEDKKLFLFEEEGFDGVYLENGPFEMQMKDITAQVKNSDDLQDILGI